MQIVIDISEHDKEWIQNGYVIPDEIHTSIVESIINGIVLPEHGRLKDIDWIDDNCRSYYTDDDGSWCYKWKDIEDAPTILDANKGE